MTTTAPDRKSRALCDLRHPVTPSDGLTPEIGREAVIRTYMGAGGNLEGQSVARRGSVPLQVPPGSLPCLQRCSGVRAGRQGNGPPRAHKSPTG